MSGLHVTYNLSHVSTIQYNGLLVDYLSGSLNITQLPVVTYYYQVNAIVEYYLPQLVPAWWPYKTQQVVKLACTA